MSISGEYYSYYMAHDYLAHHGVLGMKWGQHIFGKDKQTRGTRKAEKAKKPLFETKKQYYNRKTEENKAKERKQLALAKKYHAKEKARRQKLSKQQAIEELKFVKKLERDYDSGTDEERDRYQKMFNEISRGVWDWYSAKPRCEAAKKMQQLYDENKHIYDEIWDDSKGQKGRESRDIQRQSEELRAKARENDIKIDKLMSEEMGYKYSPEVGEYLRLIWKWD